MVSSFLFKNEKENNKLKSIIEFDHLKQDKEKREGDEIVQQLPFYSIQKCTNFRKYLRTPTFSPLTDPSVKVTALLDEDDREVELTYNPRYRRVHGLAGFYRKHNAQIGDLVETEVLEPLKKYRFRFKKKPIEEKLPLIKKPLETAPLIGPPINFRGLIYAPINENGVIFLFSKVAEDLGITIEGIQVKFPDAFGKRYERDKGYPITIEFEYRSSDYERH